jgi:hypothetical protein
VTRVTVIAAEHLATALVNFACIGSVANLEPGFVAYFFVDQTLS